VSYDDANAMKVYPGEYQVTELGHPDEMIDTQWGRITYKNWLQCESVRWMETNLRQSWIRQNPEGLVCLVSMKQYQKPVHGKE